MIKKSKQSSNIAFICQKPFTQNTHPTNYVIYELFQQTVLDHVIFALVPGSESGFFRSDPDPNLGGLSRTRICKQQNRG